jgi:hypothetical protein
MSRQGADAFLGHRAASRHANAEVSCAADSKQGQSSGCLTRSRVSEGGLRPPTCWAAGPITGLLRPNGLSPGLYREVVGEPVASIAAATW